MDRIEQHTTAPSLELGHQQQPLSDPAPTLRANLATKVLRLTLDRLSRDWQVRYGHPVLVVETFVDPARVLRHGLFS